MRHWHYDSVDLSAIDRYDFHNFQGRLNLVAPNLRIPGPTPCPPETLGELSRQMINHRGPEFAEMQGRIMDRLKTFFRTSNEVYVYTTSGTGAMEAAIVNTLSPGDKVLSSPSASSATASARSPRLTAPT